MSYRLSLAFLFLTLSPLQAGVITLETQINSSVRDGGLEAAIRVTNHGDESAHNVQLKAEAVGITKESPLQQSLAVEKSYAASFSYPLKSLAAGRYPLI